MISNITASIGMACLDIDPVPGLEINRSGSRLLQQFLLLRFSNVVQRKRNTHSEPNKGKHQHKVIYTASNTHTTQSLNFQLRKQLENIKMAKGPLLQKCLWLGIIPLNQNVMEISGCTTIIPLHQEVNFPLVTHEYNH